MLQLWERSPQSAQRKVEPDMSQYVLQISCSGKRLFLSHSPPLSHILSSFLTYFCLCSLQVPREVSLLLLPLFCQTQRNKNFDDVIKES